VGKDRPGVGPEGSLRALKPPPDRLYGRSRGHRLRPRQQRLLELTLPRLLFKPQHASAPLTAFAGEYASLWLEVGFGSGEHALAQIETHPTVALIAAEVFDNGICSLLSRLVPEGGEASASPPGNLRLWVDDARELMRQLPDECLDRLFLLFPDPWPKARHAKRRFVHPALLPLVARVLRPGGEWRVASDDPTYQTWVADVMAAQSLFDVRGPVLVRPADWPPTRYEAKALREGRAPHYWTFIRR
jgi:tRNA (guanine-N7-)-methyltransferase